jgi:putative hydrolase of HD superfamily
MLALKIFEGFSIERWNDLVRPFALVEMDKTAEKAVLAYMIGKMEESRGNTIDWNRIIYGTFFDFLRKIALCDIKSPVQRMIKEEYPEEYVQLNEWVVDQYRAIVTDSSLLQEFSDHILSFHDETDLTWRVLRAAHKYSAIREIEMIRPINERARLVEIDRGLKKDLDGLLDIRGLSQLVEKGLPYDFIMQIERLRFQTRWNQTPRVPGTSVLGHSYYVAVLTLLMSREIDCDATRVYGNFFSALFHDLPEAVTRDIISPVKQATEALPGVVKKIENRIVERELVPLMDESFRDEIMYFMSDEFENRVRGVDGKSEVVTFDELQLASKDSSKRAIDGKLVRVADHISAFVEADSSIQYGITSNHLREGRQKILALYGSGKSVNGLDVASFFREFK